MEKRVNKHVFAYGAAYAGSEEVVFVDGKYTA